MAEGERRLGLLDGELQRPEWSLDRSDFAALRLGGVAASSDASIAPLGGVDCLAALAGCGVGRC